MQKNRAIIITSDTNVRDVQIAFEEYYPFLKIEFSKSSAVIFTKCHQVNPDHLISKISGLINAVTLDVGVERTIAEVEKDCQELLGISIQISRKSGKVCNAISITNSWTLQSQNMAGEFITAEMQKAS